MININNQDIKGTIDQAYHKAGEITKSVLTLARVLKITPKQLADAVMDGDSNAGFNAEFTAELIKSFTAKALEKPTE